MGKGGESVQVKPGAVATSLLDGLADAELRKYAQQYGVSAEGSREELLSSLAPYDRAILSGAPKPLPLAPPPFTLNDLIKAIPAHCFKRDMYKSIMHVVSDLSLAAALLSVMIFIHNQNLPLWAMALIWPVYWACQGTVLTGVWVLAHECGHQAFSESKTVNDAFGLVLHSFLLVPYHSWRITHGLHHNNTGSIENDEVFVPPTRSEMKKEIVDVMPVTSFVQIVLMLTIGWMPGYLFLNSTGPKKYADQAKSHFNPYAAFFKENERTDIVVSDIFFVGALCFLGHLGYTYGAMNLVKFYVIPYMIVNFYLVLITYLQHSDVFVPHFNATEWSWFRGALCTVDRTFGPIIDHTIHHIADTHVCHHLFSKMPFYHAQEATLAIKSVIGDYYLADPTPIPTALWRSYNLCKFIEDDEPIVFYKYKTT